MSKDGGSGGAVTAGIIGFAGGFFDQLGAHILKRIGQFNVFGNGDAVIDNGRGAPFLVEGYAMSLGTKGDSDGFRQSVDAFL